MPMLDASEDWAVSARREGWITPYLAFTAHVKIDSKETGVGPLVRYGSQKRFILETCEGLDRGIRHFVNVKARQLGISTECLLLDLFWISVHDGLQGAIIFDNDGNRDKFRILFDRITESLPEEARVPIKRNNDNNLVLANGSVLDYVVAGTSSKKKGGALARSRAWSFVHGTEVSSWGSDEGVASMMASLAQVNPDRLYLFESTARGYNLFYDMVKNARADPFTQKAFFIGWWAKEIYRLARGSPEFEHYTGTPTDEEQELIDEVKKLYHFSVDAEQLAWYRWMGHAKITNSELMAQEYPWTETQAFIATGLSFFGPKRVQGRIEGIKAARVPFKGFAYHLRDQFLETTIEQVDRVADAQLRMWEDPNPNAIYTIGCDPGYGRADKDGDHCIEVFRCYADRLVQVAEYWTEQPETYQVAWVLAHLAGSYRNAWINIEVGGPGPAVMDELHHLRQLMDSGYLREQAGERGLNSVFAQVRWYLYHRPDSLSAGYAYGFKSNPDLDLMIMNQLRDGFALRSLQLRSVPLLEEMRDTVIDDGEIKADRKSGDGRVHATALANRAYVEWVRPGLIANSRTFEVVTTEERLAQERPDAVFHNTIVKEFFSLKEKERIDAQIEAAWR